MYVRKESGGTTINHRSVAYEWPEDGSVTEVPPGLGAELLGIRDGGFSEVPEPAPEVITEPGPAAEITEPGPAADITEDGKPARKGRGAKAEGTGTPA